MGVAEVNRQLSRRKIYLVSVWPDFEGDPKHDDSIYVSVIHRPDKRFYGEARSNEKFRFLSVMGYRELEKGGSIWDVPVHMEVSGTEANSDQYNMSTSIGDFVKMISEENGGAKIIPTFRENAKFLESMVKPD